MDIKTLMLLSNLNEEQLLDVQELDFIPEDLLDSVTNDFTEYSSDCQNSISELENKIKEGGVEDYEWALHTSFSTMEVLSKIEKSYTNLHTLIEWGNNWKDLCLKLIENKKSVDIDTLLSQKAIDILNLNEDDFIQKTKVENLKEDS